MFFDLPIPPSVNESYAPMKSGPKSRLYATKKLRDWKTAAGWELIIARADMERKKIEGRYSLKLILPETMMGDLSNRYKALEDLLVMHGVTQDDKHNRRVEIVPSGDVPDGRCWVFVEAVP